MIPSSGHTLIRWPRPHYQMRYGSDHLPDDFLFSIEENITDNGRGEQETNHYDVYQRRSGLYFFRFGSDECEFIEPCSVEVMRGLAGRPASCERQHQKQELLRFVADQVKRRF